MLNVLIQNKLAAGGVFILLLVGIWFGLNASSGPAPVLQTEGPISGDPDLVQTLLTLRAVNLSGTIFTDRIFMSLQDFGQQILPEPVGRQNPFAPLANRPLAPAQATPGSTPDARMFAPGQ